MSGGQDSGISFLGGGGATQPITVFLSPLTKLQGLEGVDLSETAMVRAPCSQRPHKYKQVLRGQESQGLTENLGASSHVYWPPTPGVTDNLSENSIESACPCFCFCFFHMSMFFYNLAGSGKASSRLVQRFTFSRDTS